MEKTRRFTVRMPPDLYEAMQRFMELSVEQRSEMGCRGRERMERQFSKTAVVAETIKHLEI